MLVEIKLVGDSERSNGLLSKCTGSSVPSCGPPSGYAQKWWSMAFDYRLRRRRLFFQQQLRCSICPGSRRVGGVASVLRLRYSGHGIDFGPPDDALQTYLRKIEVRAPGLLDQDARQLSLKTNR
ncbi:hypothetical protein F444_06018 [Phytophthora nicotianae P1976]|uniref:Uncharacterized protein n=1 Tax=Phytophthora nicotianae P1976 TaxID=1317066 RepID=A0A081AK50_PHYNI|nr:hypothetical protein F444_06018 [Phytophthora nicotianae P1976]